VHFDLLAAVVPRMHLLALAVYLAGGEFLEEIAEGIESNTHRGVSQDETPLSRSAAG